MPQRGGDTKGPLGVYEISDQSRAMFLEFAYELWQRVNPATHKPQLQAQKIPTQCQTLQMLQRQHALYRIIRQNLISNIPEKMDQEIE